MADALEREGITLLPSIRFLEDQMAERGAMSRRSPSKGERSDIEYGRGIARTLAGMDLGQTVVVKDRAAVALEAMEGTDEVIRRAGRIAGRGTVVVKVAKPRQDMRFDVPVVGAGTLAGDGRGGLAHPGRRGGADAAPRKAGAAERGGRGLGMAVWGMAEENE